MENNGRTFKNYTPEQVDQFLDQIINQVERMIEDNKAKNREIALKDKKIEELSKIVANTSQMQERLAQYERMEATLNRAVIMAQRTSDQIKSSAHRESELILEDARRNCPVDTGALKKSLHLSEDKKTAKKATIKVDYDKSLKYGTFVELGTRDKPGNPFLRNAVDKNQTEINKKITEVVADAVGAKM